MSTKGRDKEAALIRNANLACAAGRLLLGEISTWQEFLEPDTVDYTNLPRRQLKSGKYDIQKNLKDRIDSFCKSNFSKMTQAKLVSLYNELRVYRNFEIPYMEFQNRYSPIKGFYEKGYPEHSTVCISLWGMQYRFPEYDFSNDLIIATDQFIQTDEALDEYREKRHSQLLKNKETIADLLRKNESTKRQAMQTAFSLLECYLNGIAWSYYQKKKNGGLSERKIRTLKDISNVTLRDKIQKYPSIIFGESIGERSSQYILDEAKKFRDSLMHPSPFSAPEKFGGYDKLEKIYSLDIETVFKSISGIIEIIEKIESMKGQQAPVPIWLPGIKTAASHIFQRTEKSCTLLK
ncbi:hypothetical protein [uncultured Desulfobacter sp.]|uniref:hypothetical protein n=1 Tax=uncultured Desulfobacter sp. TaxID=240139 RepID=UPI002AAAA8B3|nr:hypothetical protein [uncultured Desulfobacter sp.]